MSISALGLLLVLEVGVVLIFGPIQLAEAAHDYVFGHPKSSVDLS